jgi:hypothetical protein
VQYSLHFPFPLVKAKGLATSSNIISIESYAVVGKVRAVDILKALQHLESSILLTYHIFSISTKGLLY